MTIFTPTPDAPPREREAWPDIFRGIAIIAVVCIHTSGHMLSQLSPCGWSWCFIATINRLLQFAVPAFLLVSAYLNASSLRNGVSSSESRISSAKAFVVRRVQSTLIPYLIASGIGLLLITHFHPSSISLRHLCKMLIFGKCYYHLYFMALVFQLYVLLPFLVRMMHRSKPLWSVLAVAAAVQLIVYAANRCFLMQQNVASSLFWYILPVSLGLWLKFCPERTRSAFRRHGRTLCLLTATAAMAYLPIAILAMVGPVDTFLCQTYNWIFSAAASLLLAVVSMRITDSHLGFWLAAMGRRSLIIYLAHPFFIVGLDHFAPEIRQSSMWLAFPIYAVMSFAAAAFGANLLSCSNTWRARVRQSPKVTDNIASAPPRSVNANASVKSPLPGFVGERCISSTVSLQRTADDRNRNLHVNRKR